MAIEKYKVTDGIFTQTRIKASGEDLEPAMKKALSNWGLESLMQKYENQAQEVLKAQGYPLDLDGLWAIDDKELPIQIFYIKAMLFDFEIVRDLVEKKNAEYAALNMACAIEAAIRAQLQPIVETVRKGVDFSLGRKKGFEKVLRRKKIREAFVDYLIKKGQHITTLKALGEGRIITFSYFDTEYQISRVYKRGRSGELNYYIRFKTPGEPAFSCSIQTFEDTIDKRLKKVL